MSSLAQKLSSFAMAMAVVLTPAAGVAKPRNDNHLSSGVQDNVRNMSRATQKGRKVSPAFQEALDTVYAYIIAQDVAAAIVETYGTDEQKDTAASVANDGTVGDAAPQLMRTYADLVNEAKTPYMIRFINEMSKAGYELGKIKQTNWDDAFYDHCHRRKSLFKNVSRAACDQFVQSQLRAMAFGQGMIDATFAKWENDSLWDNGRPGGDSFTRHCTPTPKEEDSQRGETCATLDLWQKAPELPPVMDSLPGDSDQGDDGSDDNSGDDPEDRSPASPSAPAPSAPSGAVPAVPK